MKVRLYGFEIETTGSSVSIDDLLSHLEKHSGTPDISRGTERRIYLDSNANKDYHLGLVVTVKDQKRFCRLENDHGNFKITVENLKGKDKLMEFNFFALNKSNGIGIYQHYYQSCGVNVFGGYLISYFRNIRERNIQNDIKLIQASTGKTISASTEKKIKRKHNCRLKFSQLVRKETLKVILENYKSIKAFELEYATIDLDQNKGMPLSKFVKKKREKFTFSQNWSVTDLAAGIIDTIKQINPRNGRVHVVSMNLHHSY